MANTTELWDGFHPILQGTLLTCVAVAIMSSLGSRFDTRTVDTQGVWMKPLKFSLSIGIYLFTLGIIFRDLPDIWQTRYSLTFCALMTLELVPILIQAARGVPSHYNTRSLFDATLYSVMGVSIGINSLLLAVVGIHLHLFHESSDPLWIQSITWGIVVLILGSAVGGLMSASGHHRTRLSSRNHRRLPFLGWQLDGGDLRMAHFVGLHALQIMMLAALALEAPPFQSLDRGAKSFALTSLGGAIALLTTGLALFAQIGQWPRRFKTPTLTKRSSEAQTGLSAHQKAPDQRKRPSSGH